MEQPSLPGSVPSGARGAEAGARAATGTRRGDDAGAADRSVRRRDLAILGIVGLILFGWSLGAHDFWPPDEARYALNAREMRDRGDLLVVHLNDRPDIDKPPLYLWTINLAALLTGSVDEWAVRIPSAAAAILAMGLIYWLGTRLYDRPTALRGALVFATALQIVVRGRWGAIDMTLNLFILAAIALLWVGWKEPGRRAACFAGAWACMGLATLSKGPIGVILPLISVLPVVLAARDWPAIRRLFRPGGPLICLAVIAAWFVPFWLRVGTQVAVGDFLWHNNFDRYVEAWNVQHPVWYYLWRFPAGFFPWIVFLPWAVAHVFSAEDRDRREAATFLTVWFLAIFLFFSFSTGKRGVYIIPAYPAAALVVGRLLATGGRRLRGPILLWFGCAGALAIALPVMAAHRAPDLLPIGVAAGIVCVAGALVAFLFRAGGRPGRTLTAIAASVLALIGFGIGAVEPWVDRHQNISGFAAEFTRRLSPGAEFATTKQKRDAWVYYARRFSPILDNPDTVLRYLQDPGPRDLVIEAAILDRIRDRLPPDVVEVHRGRVGSQEYFLLHRAGGAEGSS
jgi:4-amino-4-deoxy-L-arabinose transferase-like glycosyltransferase